MAAQTPAELGFRMPAEWEPQEATWLAWPHNKDDWPGKFTPIAWVYADIIRKLTRVQRVHLLVRDAEMEGKVRSLLRRVDVPHDSVRCFHAETNRSWTRDYCPLFVKNRQGDVAVTDWHFNGWAKYPNWAADDAVPRMIASALHLPTWQPHWQERRVVLEGGSIEVNGAGLLLSTEECLLSDVQQRNPGLTREDIEAVFARYLGVQKVLWLRYGIAGDDTHGHVDDLARFTDPHTVVTVVEPDRTEVNYAPLQENLALLRRMTDEAGQPLRVETLPMPAPIHYAGQRLPASYANFYIANGLVLVPTFNDYRDREALNTLARLFPQHEIVGIHALDLVLGLGTLHCMTQQQPAG